MEALNEMETNWTEGGRAPADAVLNQFFRKRRFIGSKDRGEISRVVYAVLRNEMALDWQLEQGGLAKTPRGQVLAESVLLGGVELENLKELCDGQQYAPARLSEDEQTWIKSHAGQPLTDETMPDSVRHGFPEWLAPRFTELFGEDLPNATAALNREAPVDLRVNTLKTNRDEVLEALTRAGLEPKPTPHSAVGIRLLRRGALFATEAFRAGWFEMQDEGSQLVAALVKAEPGDKGIDFCAGAGGKTLALAAQMENRGRILAWDTSGKRLGQMRPRLGRAGVSNVQSRVLKSERDNVVKRHRDSADWVLLDVPCTGTGTWRRSPDLRRRTSPEALVEVQDHQRAILESAARLLKSGGRLIYATCSILPEENEHQVEAFLESHADFTRTAEDLRLYPHTHGTDGFFGAVMQKA